MGVMGQGGHHLDVIARLLWPAPPSTYGPESFPGELLWVPRRPKSATGGPRGPRSMAPRPAKPVQECWPPEDLVPCLFLPYASARYIVLFLHGNADDIGRCRSFCQAIRDQFQVHVFAVEYPGYGICPGGPCDEMSVMENTLAALRFIRETLRWPLDSILVFGRSIGCCPALSLCVHYEVGGLVLISPMLSLKALARDFAGPLVPMVLSERIPNRERMSYVRSQVLIVHGGKDVIIPQRHGVELFRACRSRKLLVLPPEMGHNTDLFSDLNYLVVPMLRFFPLPDYCFDDPQVPAWAYLYGSQQQPEEPTLELPMGLAQLIGSLPRPSEDDTGQAQTRPDAVPPPALDVSSAAPRQEPAETAPAKQEEEEDRGQPPMPVVRLPPQRQERTASRSMLRDVQTTCLKSDELLTEMRVELLTSAEMEMEAELVSPDTWSDAEAWSQFEMSAI